MTITMIPKEGIPLTAAAEAAIKDITKAADAKKSAATTSNTINHYNTPSHDPKYVDNFIRTRVIVHVAAYDKDNKYYELDIEYWVDDNGVYYNSGGIPVLVNEIGMSQYDTDKALEEAKKEQASGIPIGANTSFYDYYSMIGDKFTEEQWRTVYVRGYNDGKPLSDAEWKVIWDGRPQ